MKHRVDYDQIAGTYHQRYTENPMVGVQNALIHLVHEQSPVRVLEVGCGTGWWLKLLKGQIGDVFGLDLSRGMLREAQRLVGDMPLVQAKATELPVAVESFDLLYCMNAFHHFGDPSGFIHTAYDCLRKGGILAIIGSDPRRSEDYLYQYFDGVYERDLERFPAWEQITEWMIVTGFRQTGIEIVDITTEEIYGKKILEHYFLQKNSSSQLALLTDEAYAQGVDRIRADIASSEKTGSEVVFHVNLQIGLVWGRR